jgi:NHLM bacteriocin system ABC transporter ATP-binding protein
LEALVSTQPIEREIQTQPPRTFSIDNRCEMWLIRRGSAELFLSEVRDGEPVGRRYPVLHLDEGEAIFGIEPSFVSGFVFCASPAPGTEIETISRESLTTTNSLLERWIESLSGCVSSSAFPTRSVTIEARMRFKIAGVSQTVAPSRGIVWVKLLTGTARFQAREDFGVIDRPGYFPITRSGWLQVMDGSELYAAESREVIRTGKVWQALDRFHEVIAACLVSKRRSEEAHEAARLRKSAATDAAVTAAALAQLCVPLSPAGKSARTEGHTVTDPVFRACRVVGEQMGISMKPSPEMVRGISVSDPVEAVARASSVRGRWVALKGTWWRQDNGPLFAYRGESRKPVALLPRSNSGYTLYDPADRLSVKVDAAVAAEIQMYAFVFFRPFPAKKLGVLDLLAFGSRHCHKEIFQVALMGIAAGLLALMTPVATGVIFDSLIPSADRSQLLGMAVFLFAAAISGALFTLARSVAMLRVQIKMHQSLQAAVWDRVLGLPVPFFRNYNSGDLAERTMGIDQIRQTLTGRTINSIVSGVFSAFSFGLLFYYSWPLALLASALASAAVLVTAAFGYADVRCQRQISAMQGRISGTVLQFLSGIAKLRASGTEHRAFAVWARDFTAQTKLEVKDNRIKNLVTAFNEVFPLICLLFIFGLGAGLVAKPESGGLTTGHFLAFLVAFNQFLTSAVQLSSSVISSLTIIPLYERAKPILETLPESAVARTRPGTLQGAIQVNHITFRYRSDAPLVLNDVSFVIQPGQFVAVVGSSGSGKSTLLRLLLGFEVPESGSVFYDGQNLAGLDLRSVRQQMGVVLQGGSLISGSILRNIIGSAPLTLDDAWEAARLAGVEEDIRRMPMGMHTFIGENGGGLSGGQRQRLLIARALIKRPRILFFDEATSALDNRTQELVSRSLESLNATRVVIAHRLSTILNADRILVIEKGVLVQSGTYEELMSGHGVFRELARRQSN